MVTCMQECVAFTLPQLLGPMDAKNWIKGALCREKHINGAKIQKTAKIRDPERERERLKSRCLGS